jgi:uncharacterized protein YbaR (Trm112 family)
MHILVTDRLTCPRCGPDFGLILFADELKDRRVISGSLGCPNCRERYPVRDGLADLRPSPRPLLGASEPAAAHEEPEAAVRLAALLGVEEGPGLVLLMGPAAGHAVRLAEMLPEIEVIAIYPDVGRGRESEGVSRMAVGDRLPFRTGSVRGAVLEGGTREALLSEALRSLSPGSRLVCLRTGSGTAAEIAAHGGKVLLKSETALVGVKQ